MWLLFGRYLEISFFAFPATTGMRVYLIQVSVKSCSSVTVKLLRPLAEEGYSHGAMVLILIHTFKCEEKVVICA